MSEHDDWAEINRLEAENARLRAELAAERECVQLWAIDAGKFEAERDALRELLREARMYVDDDAPPRCRLWLDCSRASTPR